MIEAIIEWSIRNRFLVILASVVLGVAWGYPLVERLIISR